jgi:hypothetical protein
MLDVDDEIARFEAWWSADEVGVYDRASLGDELAVYKRLNELAPMDHPGAASPPPNQAPQPAPGRSDDAVP